jgi:hypothetical protein
MAKTGTQEMGTADTHNSPKTGAPIMRLTPSNGKQHRNKQRKMVINLSGPYTINNNVIICNVITSKSLPSLILHYFSTLHNHLK